MVWTPVRVILMMTSRILTVCVVLSTTHVVMLVCLVRSGFYDVLCPDGWFGENCMFQCHCSFSGICDNYGSCPRGEECKFGYFGPACQYIDACSIICTADVPNFVRDNNDQTCTPPGLTTPIVLVFNVEFVFHWIRIVVNDPKKLHTFSLRLNYFNPCVNERRFPVSDISVDVYCDNPEELSQMQLNGDSTGSVCSIYVSSGRNLALKQEVWQSSENSTVSSNAPASFAIDALTDDPTAPTCSMATARLHPKWEVNYTREAVLTYVLIYNPIDTTRRFAKFNLTTAKGNSKTNFFTRNNNATLYVYLAVLKSKDYTTSLSIVGWDIQVMVLCEVETYGETICPDGTYGTSCAEACNCWANQSCAVATGSCSSPCVAGRYGFKCSRNCSITCADGVCRERSGHCYSCKAGYMGEFCGEKCSAGTFGPNCISTCSKHCNQTCDYMNGTCDCLNGRQGSLCTECPHGKFGNVCTDNCSVACRSGACDPETGACTGCRDGMYGPECILACPSTCKLPKCDIDGSCTECNKGYYGTNCTLSCSRLCKDMDCNITTGACLECLTGQLPNCTACPNGLYGKNCNSSCPEFCQDNLCDIQIGQCFGCQGNRLLPLCKDLRYSADPQQFSVHNKVFWMVMALFSLTALMLFIFLSTRRSTPPRFENM